MDLVYFSTPVDFVAWYRARDLSACKDYGAGKRNVEGFWKRVSPSQGADKLQDVIGMAPGTGSIFLATVVEGRRVFSRFLIHANDLQVNVRKIGRRDFHLTYAYQGGLIRQLARLGNSLWAVRYSGEPGPNPYQLVEFRVPGDREGEWATLLP